MLLQRVPLCWLLFLAGSFVSVKIKRFPISCEFRHSSCACFRKERDDPNCRWFCYQDCFPPSSFLEIAGRVISLTVFTKISSCFPENCLVVLRLEGAGLAGLCQGREGRKHHWFSCWSQESSWGSLVIVILSIWIKLRLSAWEAVWMEKDQMEDLLFIIIMSPPDLLITVPLKIISSWFSSL